MVVCLLIMLDSPTLIRAKLVGRFVSLSAPCKGSHILIDMMPMG